MKVAINTISDFLLENAITVYIAIFDRKAYKISEKLFFDVAVYIDDNYVDAYTDNISIRPSFMEQILQEETSYAAPSVPKALSTKSLDDTLSQIGESFSEMLLRKIDEKDMTDV